MIPRKIDILLKVIFSICLLIYISSWGLISIDPLLLRINSCIGIASCIYLIFFEKKSKKWGCWNSMTKIERIRVENNGPLYFDGVSNLNIN